MGSLLRGPATRCSSTGSGSTRHQARSFDSLNPYTGQAWATMPDGQEEDVDRAVKAARGRPWTTRTGSGWRPCSAGLLLRRFADLLRDNAEHLAHVETRDNGKLIREMLGQARALPGYYYYYAGLADKILGETIPLENASIFNYTLREPLGVVAIITPWNSPLAHPQLQPGRGPGRRQYRGGEALRARLRVDPGVREAGAESGFPAGRFQRGHRASGRPRGRRWCSHPGVDKVVFTGGTEVGKVVARQCCGQRHAPAAGAGRQVAQHRLRRCRPSPMR